MFPCREVTFEACIYFAWGYFPAFDMEELIIKGGQMHSLIVQSRKSKAGMNYKRVYLTELGHFAHGQFAHGQFA